MSGTPVNILIKCRENTIDGGKKRESFYVQIVPRKEKLDTGGYVLHCDTATNGSQCLKHLTVLVLSSRTQSAAPGPPVTHPKGCFVTKTFFKKKGIFEKETNKKRKPYTFHRRTFINTEANAERVRLLLVKDD